MQNNFRLDCQVIYSLGNNDIFLWNFLLLLYGCVNEFLGLCYLGTRKELELFKHFKNKKNNVTKPILNTNRK